MGCCNTLQYHGHLTVVVYKEKRTKQNNNKTVPHKHPWTPFVLVNYPRAWGLHWSVVDTSRDTPAGASNTFLGQQVINCNSFFTHIHAGILSGLNLCRSYVCYQSL